MGGRDGMGKDTDCVRKPLGRVVSEVSARSSHTHSRAAENKPMVTKTKWIVSASHCRRDGQIGTASPEGIRIVGKAHLRRATTDGGIDFLQRKPQALRL